jgi:hypothetical protein
MSTEHSIMRDLLAGNGVIFPEPKPVTCPPSEVHDMIVPFAEVCEGDLIPWDGELRTV